MCSGIGLSAMECSANISKCFSADHLREPYRLPVFEWLLNALVFLNSLSLALSVRDWK